MCPACLCCLVRQYAAVLATGPDEIRVSDANQPVAIKVALDAAVSSDERFHSVWVFHHSSLAPFVYPAFFELRLEFFVSPLCGNSLS